jgi:peptidoglycan/xylan/chitin deacetylase (PgdA/CDA1 family)
MLAGGISTHLLWPLALWSLLPSPHPTPADILTHVKTKRPVIAITINDGPEGRIVPAMLQLLRRHGAQATFFVSGQAIAGDPQMLLEIQEARSEVANHGYHHRAMRGLPEDRLRREVASTARLVADALGTGPRYLRPPYGQFDRAWQRAGRAESERLVLWNVGGADETVHVWPRTLHPGDIIALRDDTEGLRRLRQALAMAEQLHLQPVTLSALLQG